MKPRRPSSVWRQQQSDARERARWPEEVVGGKYVRQLQRYVDGLREEDAHGNRKLFLDDVFVTYLLAFFNPTLRTLRTIEDFSQSRQAQRHLSTTKICRSTLSDFNRLVDPERLTPILAALRPHVAAQRAAAAAGEGEPAQLPARTVAVDGTFLPALAETAWAVRALNQTDSTRYRARLDVQLSISDGIPEAIVVPEPGQGESAAAAATQVLPGKLYLYDRGFNGFGLINAHYAPDQTPRARFVVRYRQAGSNAPELEEVETLPLTADDRAAGVVSDRTGRFVSRSPDVPTVLLRETIVETIVRGEPQRLRLISNLLEVSAATIGLLYRQRWQVELFFRWLQCFGNFNHLLSATRQGVQAQFYVTVIAAMLMHLHAGGRPSKYLFSLMSLVAGGAALEEILPILQERERQCDLARRSAAKRRANAAQPKQP